MDTTAAATTTTRRSRTITKIRGAWSWPRMNEIATLRVCLSGCACVCVCVRCVERPASNTTTGRTRRTTTTTKTTPTTGHHKNQSMNMFSLLFIKIFIWLWANCACGSWNQSGNSSVWIIVSLVPQLLDKHIFIDDDEGEQERVGHRRMRKGFAHWNQSEIRVNKNVSKHKMNIINGR